MGTILVQSIMAKVSLLLMDEGGARYGDDELLGWYNEALKDIVKPEHKPEANTKAFIMSLQTGAVQALPAGYIRFMDVGRNMGADGATPGKIPSKAMKEVLDTAFPEWQQSDPDVIVDTVAVSPATPKLFFTYPPQPATPGHLELYATAYPVKVETDELDAAVLELEDTYETAVVEYMMNRACDKESDDPAMAQKAANHYMKYLGELGITPTQPGAST